MIFVTVGTQKQDFSRLLKYIETLELKEEIIIQTGYTKYKTNYKEIKFVDNIEEYYKKAEIVITHGGVGTIMSALEAGAKVIVIPRLKAYDEHVDDHQIEITNKFFKLNYILKANNFNELKECMKIVKTHEFDKYKSNTKEFNEKLANIILKLVNNG